GNPLVYGEKNTGAATTILYYIHYDGQPVDPPKWKQEGGPFHPLLREGRMEDGARTVADVSAVRRFPAEWRLYARSASDDKAPIVALCAAVDAVGGKLASNVHVLIDGEEEAGSPSLTAAIARYRSRFAADALLILDGPLHPAGHPTLAFGARGML